MLSTGDVLYALDRHGILVGYRRQPKSTEMKGYHKVLAKDTLEEAMYRLDVVPVRKKDALYLRRCDVRALLAHYGVDA